MEPMDRKMMEEIEMNTETSESKTVEIKRHELHVIAGRIMEEDESTNKMISQMPIMTLVIWTFLEKLEKRLFDDEEE